MATIRKLPNNKFRAEIRKNQSTIKTKTFSDLQSAEDWGNEVLLMASLFVAYSIKLSLEKPCQNI